MVTSHACDALVITCIDFRIQRTINKWLKAYVKDYVYDRVALAGGVYDLYAILKQLDISHRLHNIHKVILVNHEDCGAYGKEGSFERHKRDLEIAAEVIEKLYSLIDVETYFVGLDGTVREVSRSNPQGHD